MYQPHAGILPNPPIKVAFPPKDTKGRELIAATQFVSISKGTCCASFLDRAYRMAYDRRSKNILFLIADFKQTPQKPSFGRFVLVGDSVPSPGYYMVTSDNRFIQQEFPKWWQDEK